MPADRSPLDLLADDHVRRRLCGDAGLPPATEVHRRGERRRRRTLVGTVTTGALVLALVVAGVVVAPRLGDSADTLGVAGMPENDQGLPPSALDPALDGALLSAEALGPRWRQDPAAGVLFCEVDAVRPLASAVRTFSTGGVLPEGAVQYVGRGPRPAVDLQKGVACLPDGFPMSSASDQRIGGPGTPNSETARAYTAVVKGRDAHRAVAVLADRGGVWSLVVARADVDTDVAPAEELAAAQTRALCRTTGACDPADVRVQPTDIPSEIPERNEPPGLPAGQSTSDRLLIDVTDEPPSTAGRYDTGLGPRLVDQALCDVAPLRLGGQQWGSNAYAGTQSYAVLSSPAEAALVVERLSGVTPAGTGDACPAPATSLTPARLARDGLPAGLTLARSGSAQVYALRRGVVVTVLVVEGPISDAALARLVGRMATGTCAEAASAC